MVLYSSIASWVAWCVACELFTGFLLSAPIKISNVFPNPTTVPCSGLCLSPRFPVTFPRECAQFRPGACKCSEMLTALGLRIERTAMAARVVFQGVPQLFLFSQVVEPILVTAAPPREVKRQPNRGTEVLVERRADGGSLPLALSSINYSTVCRVLLCVSLGLDKRTTYG
jgi:hypothetical protein